MNKLPAQATGLQDFTPETQLQEEHRRVLNKIQETQPVTRSTLAETLDKEYPEIERIVQDLVEKKEARRTGWIKNRYGNKTPQYEAVNY